MLTGLLAERLPELHTHFAACHFDAGIVTTSWFITLFMECCPLEVRPRHAGARGCVRRFGPLLTRADAFCVCVCVCVCVRL